MAKLLMLIGWTAYQAKCLAPWLTAYLLIPVLAWFCYIGSGAWRNDK